MRRPGLGRMVQIGEIRSPYDGYGFETYEGQESYYAGDEYLDGTGGVYETYEGAPPMRRGIPGAWRRPPPPGSPLLVHQRIPVRPPVPLPSKGKVVMETFSIQPRGAGGAATILTVNTNTVRTQVFGFTIPTGNYFEFNPADTEQEVLFTPFNSSGCSDTDFILGRLDVEIETPTAGRSIRVYDSNTMWHRPGSNVSSVGPQRRWKQYIVAGPGDVVNFFFTNTVANAAAGVLQATNVCSNLTAVVRIRDA